MMPVERTEQQPHLIDWLAAYLEAHGASPKAPAMKIAADDAELVRRFHRARGVLHALEQTLPITGVPQPPHDDCSEKTPCGYSTPQQIGRFLVLSELGRGGGGVVVRALDPVLDRVVAVKLPRPEAVISLPLRERFLREARAVAVLSHPHLVQVYDVGTIGSVPYIASAYSPGPNLSQWLGQQREAVPPKLAARLVAVLAETVDYVHRQGLLHRDLKPSNILLDPLPDDALSPCTGRDDELPFTPKLTDFGLAKELAPSVEQTRTGTILGTPRYMAPEQAGGCLDQIVPATDVYALGAILYEVLTGRPPFCGRTDQEVLRRIIDGKLTWPRAWRSDLPRDLEAICLKCLEPDSRRRYRTARELADDLQHFLARRPVRARAAGPAVRLGKWCRRRPLVAVLICGLSAAMVVGVAGISWQWWRAEQYRDLAEASFHQAHDTVRQFHALLDDDRFDALEFQPLREEILASVLQYYEQFVRRNDHDPRLRVDLADAHYIIGFIRMVDGFHAEALPHLQTSLALWDELARQDPDNRQYAHFQSKAHAALGHLYKRSSRDEAALANYRRACEIREKLTAEQPADPDQQNELADVYQCLGDVYQDLHRPEQTKRFLELALQTRQKVNSGGPLALHQMAQTYHALGSFYLKNSDDRRAQGFYKQTRAILEKLASQGLREPWASGDLAIVYCGLGQIASEMGDDATAVTYYGSAYSTLDHLVQKYSESVSLTLDLAKVSSKLGLLLLKAERAAEASEYFHRARTLREELLRRNPARSDYARSLAKTYGYLGRAHAASGGAEEAVKWHRREIDLLKKLLPDDSASPALHPDLASAYSRLASQLRELKLVEEAGGAAERSDYHRARSDKLPPQPSDLAAGDGKPSPN